MLKKVRCSDCNGYGLVCQTTEYSVTAKICSVCDGLGYIESPMTNADRIRAMSDEELAQQMSKCTYFGACQDFDIKVKRECDSNCYDCILEWLKQPAEGE